MDDQTTVMIDLSGFSRIHKSTREKLRLSAQATYATDASGKEWVQYFILKPKTAKELIDFLLKCVDTIRCYYCGWSIAPVAEDHAFASYNGADVVITLERTYDNDY